MQYLPPFVVHGTHRFVKKDIEIYTAQYRKLLVSLAQDSIPAEQWQTVTYLNDLAHISEKYQY
jgi:glutathione-regulated potassium-efflux system ancillary protein KefG